MSPQRLHHEPCLPETAHTVDVDVSLRFTLEHMMDPIDCAAPAVRRRPLTLVATGP